MKNFIYVISYYAYNVADDNKDAYQVSGTAFSKKKDAEAEAKILRYCGHRRVRISKIFIK